MVGVLTGSLLTFLVLGVFQVSPKISLENSAIQPVAPVSKETFKEQAIKPPSVQIGDYLATMIYLDPDLKEKSRAYVEVVDIDMTTVTLKYSKTNREEVYLLAEVGIYYDKETETFQQDLKSALYKRTIQKYLK